MGQNIEFLSTKSNYTESKENTLKEPKNESSMDDEVFADFGQFIVDDDDDMPF
jgi:hypothetical protein